MSSRAPQVLAGHTDNVHIVAFSPDGRLLGSTSGDGTVRLWDLSHPGVSPVLRGHMGPVWFVAFSPDGRTLATSGDHGSLLHWQRSDDVTALDFRRAGALEGHQGDIWQIEFSADGRQLVSAGVDKTARIWSLDTWTCSPRHRCPVPSRCGEPMVTEAHSSSSVMAGTRLPRPRAAPRVEFAQ